MRVIKDAQVQDDNWSVVAEDEPVPSEGDVLVSLAIWNAQQKQLANRSGKVGVVLASNESPTEIEGLSEVALIAIDFPKYVDGRGYSSARLLRSRLNYQGELRAIGDVLHDQLFFMARCGINSFALKAGKDFDGAVAALKDFSVTYQAAADDERPLFRRVER